MKCLTTVIVLLTSTLLNQACVCSLCKQPKPRVVVRTIVKFVYPDTGTETDPLEVKPLDNSKSLCEKDNLRTLLKNLNNTTSDLDSCSVRLERVIKDVEKAKKDEKELNEKLKKEHEDELKRNADGD